MIIKKPWGQEEILELNDKYMLKRIMMYEGKRCSLQYHDEKTETIYVLFGQLLVYNGFNREKLEPRLIRQFGYITILPKMIHRMEAIKNSIYLETSTPEIDDVIRLEDDYNRI